MGQLCTIEPAAARMPPRGALVGDLGELYAGWIDVEQSNMDRMDEYRVENLLKFPGGWVSVQHCSWSRPVECLWTTSERCFVFDLSLDSRKAATTAEYLGLGRAPGPVSIGTMYMVPPGQTMLLRAKRGQARSMRCLIHADLIEAHLPNRLVWDLRRASTEDMARLGGGQIEWLLRRIYRELHEPDFATADMVVSLTRQLAVEIVRRFKLRAEEPSYLMGGLAPWRMRLIRERVYSDLPVPNLGELAALCDMTIRHLSRGFRAETGQTVGKYVESAMAERAKAMLTAGASVREVAARLGYATSGSFSCAFRRATGLLPRELKSA